MPQLQSEEVAEEDRANTKEQGGIMYSWKDRLRDFLGMDRAAGVRMAMAVVIAVIIAAVIITQIGVTQGAYNVDSARWEQGLTTMGSTVANNAKDIGDNYVYIKGLKTQVGNFSVTQFDGVANTVALQGSSIESVKGRLDIAEGNITALNAELATICSPPEAYLTGNLTTGNITIHAEASSNGTYTANVYLVYSRAFSFNGTYAEAQQHFYSGINWTTGTPYYTTIVATNGTHWGLAGVWWSIGAFTLTADTDTPINVVFGGLTDAPSYAYVEIYPVLK